VSVSARCMLLPSAACCIAASCVHADPLCAATGPRTGTSSAPHDIFVRCGCARCAVECAGALGVQTLTQHALRHAPRCAHDGGDPQVPEATMHFSTPQGQVSELRPSLVMAGQPTAPGQPWQQHASTKPPSSRPVRTHRLPCCRRRAALVAYSASLPLPACLPACMPACLPHRCLSTAS
jgi:hypothetical protein